MAETVSVKKDVDITCKCAECGEELTISCTADSWGDIECDVEICDCSKGSEED